MGRRGLVGLLVMYKSHGAKGRQFESTPFHVFFVEGMPASRWPQEEDENKTGCRDVGTQGETAKMDEERRRIESGMDTRKGSVRFEDD